MLTYTSPVIDAAIAGMQAKANAAVASVINQAPCRRPLLKATDAELEARLRTEINLLRADHWSASLFAVTAIKQEMACRAREASQVAA